MASPQGPESDPLLLTYKKAIMKLGVSTSQFYRLMRQGEIRPLRLGPQVRRVSLAELEAYVARLEAAQHGDRSAA
jgi:excisionase family DNA binding protein